MSTPPAPPALPSPPASRGAITTSVREYRPLIEEIVAKVWPELPNGADWIELQVLQESAGKPKAVSISGAMGLLQLMPGTATELGVKHPMDPRENLTGGITYLASRYRRLPEIPNHLDRMCWSLAAYNGGLGYVNKALQVARIDIPEDWWKWDPGKYWLMSRKCTVSWRYPDYRQMWGYVDTIVRNFTQAGRS